MKYPILISLIILITADKIMCPLEINTTVSCTKENQPVCAFSSEGFQLGTFENPCFACRAEKASFYENDACILTSAPSETTNQGSQDNSSTTSNGNKIYKCDIPKSDNPICPAVIKPTFGLYNPSIQCVKAPCGRLFGNECEACSDKDIDSYIYEDNQDIPEKDPQNPPDGSIIYCTEPRPEICTAEYIDTCAFISTPCFSESCMISAGNFCDACSRKEVVGYIKQSCSLYTQAYTQGKSDLDDQKPETNNGTDDQDYDGDNQTQHQCGKDRPGACKNDVNEVCATFKCNDTTCQKEYQNECYACLDSTTISYNQGKCQTLSGIILSLALFTQLII